MDCTEALTADPAAMRTEMAESTSEQNLLFAGVVDTLSPVCAYGSCVCVCGGGHTCQSCMDVSKILANLLR